MKTAGRHSRFRGFIEDLSRRERIAWAICALACLLVLVGGAVEIGPDLRAEHGQGIRGTWVAEQYVCYKGDCHWNGDFFLPNGTEAEHNVQYTDAPPAHRGLRLPALDSGGTDVYPVKGSRQWIHDTILAVGGGIGFLVLGGGWICAWFRVWRRTEITRLTPWCSRRRSAGSCR